MLYCQSTPLDHCAEAAYVLTFSRGCGHEYPLRLLVCSEHGNEHRARPKADRETSCERCGHEGPLTLVRIEDVFEEEVVVHLARAAVVTSALSQITLAYDRAYQAVADRGLKPVTAYRMPVQWPSEGGAFAAAETMEAHVTLAVTVPTS